MRIGSHRRFRLLWWTCFFNLFLLASVPAGAQGTSASIIGQVRDESGGVLPGVTVTATSPALQVPQVVSITDESGEYRLTPLPIGTYLVAYELTGFQTVRQANVRLTVGFVAKVDVVLKVGSLAESITVSGAAPVVDVTTTGTSTQFTRETLELIPTSRNGLIGLLAQAAGVRGNLDVGGSSMSQKPYARVYGQSGEANYFIEGVFTNELSGGNYWDYATIEEARVQTVGSTADVPSRGVNVSAIIKSGSNEYHGTALWSQISPSLQSNNITPELAAQGITSGPRLRGRYDVSGDLGGRIIRNRLWFYGGLRRRTQHSEPLNAFKPDGSPATNDSVMRFHTEKVSYQMTPANRFVGFFQRATKVEISGASQLVAWESRTHLPTFLNIGKIEYQGVRGNSLFVSLQYGNWNQRSPFEVHSDVPPAIDLTTLKVWGMNVSGGQRHSAHRHDPKATITWYVPKLFYGNHEFKTGFGVQYNAASRAYVNTFTYRRIFNNGSPFQLEAFNYPTVPTPRSETLYGYASDSLTFGRRLTLNLGFRYVRDNGFVEAACQDAADPPGHLAFPAGCYPMVQWQVWSSVAPRLYAAYDLSGDGRTVLKGGWGRFDHLRGLEPELLLTDPKGAGSATYRWRDLNGNNDYDPGEVNLDPNGTDFISSNTGAVGVLNPNEKQPKTDEFSLSLERELVADLAMRIVGVYSRTVDSFRLQNNLRPFDAYNVLITRPDPGPDGRVGSADDPDRFITYYEFAPELAGRRFEEFSLINDRGADLRYTTIELSGFKRFSRGWQFMASYAATKSDVPVVAGLVQSTVNAAVRAGDYNPNAEINSADRTWEWTAKASGTYTCPYDLSVSGNWEHRSGVSWGRQALFTGGRTIPSIVLNVEPIGTRRLPNTNIVDVRVEKKFRVLSGHNAIVRMNIYNVINASTVTSLVMRSGSTFLRPIAIMEPRVAEFTLSYMF